MMIKWFSNRTGARITTRGFSIGELLIVITVVAVLVAILLPVMAGEQEKSRSAVCISNEKQLGVAANEYCADNNRFLPPIFQPNPGDSPWWRELDPYTKSQTIYACPDDTYSRSTFGDGSPVSYSMSFNWGDWGECPGGACNNQARFSAAGAQMSRISSPSTSILIAERWDYFKNWNDSSGADMFCNDSDFLYGPGGSPTAPSLPRASIGHEGGSNYLLCDGHAKWMHFEQTMLPVTNTEPTYAQIAAEWRADYGSGSPAACPTSLSPHAPKSSSLGMWSIIQ